MSDKVKDLEKIEKTLKESGKLGFAAFLAWASEEEIDGADVTVSELVGDGKVKIDYVLGCYEVV